MCNTEVIKELLTGAKAERVQKEESHGAELNVKSRENQRA